MSQVISLGSADTIGYSGVVNKVGIGTNNPTTKLQLTAVNTINFDVDGTYPRIQFSGQAPIINWSLDKNIYFGETTNTGNVLFRPNGKVGIGTSSPSEKLEVVGNIKASGYLILGNNYLWVDPSGRLRIKGSLPSGVVDGIVVGTQL